VRVILVHQVVVDALALRADRNLRCFVQQAEYLRRHAIGDLQDAPESNLDEVFGVSGETRDEQETLEEAEF
jgi:hypothetical protein